MYNKKWISRILKKFPIHTVDTDYNFFVDSQCKIAQHSIIQGPGIFYFELETVMYIIIYYWRIQ